jgi:GMP synthase (glutamine-hydrolysing)
VKPFLFLGTRAEDDVAQQEYDAVRAGCGLRPEELVRVRLEAGPLGEVDLDDWSGIVLGGGPYNMSDPQDRKSPAQRRAEAELHDLALRVVEADFPFLGACYGIGVLGTLGGGGVVDRTFGEPIGALPVRLTDEGRADPLFGVMPEQFDAYLGHKEAVARLPDGAVLLASTDTCPVHAFRLGRNVYATQFHPELDPVAICDRIDAYSAHGYYEPHEQEQLKAAAREATVTEPVRLLARFVELYARCDATHSYSSSPDLLP